MEMAVMIGHGCRHIIDTVYLPMWDRKTEIFDLSLHCVYFVRVKGRILI